MVYKSIGLRHFQKVIARLALRLAQTEDVVLIFLKTQHGFHRNSRLCDTRMKTLCETALLMDFVLFALPAPVLSGIEAVAGMLLDLVILALAALVIGLIWAVTRNGLASIFIALIIACIVAARGLLGVADGNLILLVLAAAVASCDITAYFVGRRIGGAKLAPSISPNKTCSGAIGGTVGAVAACLLVSSNSWLSPMEAVVGGICLAVLAQAGDLIESALKRRVGVKDSGSLIPGHGGFLDRFDGYLLTLPAVYLYILAIQ